MHLIVFYTLEKTGDTLEKAGDSIFTAEKAGDGIHAILGQPTRE
jgi:hypothetical protein